MLIITRKKRASVLYIATNAIAASGGATTLTTWAGAAPTLTGLDGTYPATPGGAFVVSSGTITFNPAGAAPFQAVLAGLTLRASAVIGGQTVAVDVIGEVQVALLLDVLPTRARVLGPELVTNGTFDSDVSGWQTELWGGSGTGLSWSDGAAVVNGAVDAGISQAIATQTGKQYRISAYMKPPLGFPMAFGTNRDRSKHPFVSGGFVSSIGQTRSQVLTANPGGHVLVRLGGNPGGVVNTIFDNVSCRECITGALSAGQAVTLATGIDYTVDAGAAMSIVAGAGTAFYMQNTAAANTVGAITLAGGGSITITAGATTLSARLVSGAYDQTLTVPWAAADRVQAALWIGDDGQAHLRATNFAGGWHEDTASLSGWTGAGITAATLAGPAGVGLSRALETPIPSVSVAFVGTIERGASGAVRLYSDTGGKGAHVLVWSSAAGVAEATVDLLQASTPAALKAGSLQVLSTATGSHTGTNTTSHGITMPAGIEAGDLLLAFFSCDGTATHTPSAGWTELATAVRSTNVRGSAFWKVATGSDSLTITTSEGEASSHVVYRISGAGTSAPDVATANGFGIPDAPGLSPAGGSADYLWIVAAMSDGQSTVTAAPADFGGLLTVSHANSYGASIGAAHRIHTAGSLDPAAFAAGGSQNFVAMTIAVRAA